MGWTLENNVVIADHYHGITLLGARGCRVVNNTVFDTDPEPPGPAWIHIGRHKHGAPSQGCVIRNNLTAALHDTEGQDVESDHNLLITDPAKVFQDAARYDLRLRPGGPAIGAGSGEDAPTEDITRRPRPQGTAVAVGAYEYRGQ